MTRTMYDSTSAADIPANAQMVAGYVDGAYRWTPGEWERFAHATQVHIATQPATDDGDVLDVEFGDATVAEAAPWCRMRIASGLDWPGIYIAKFQMAEVEAALTGIPHALWVADWTGEPHAVAGAVAAQYADPRTSGGHYDLSLVTDDGWMASAPPATGDEMTLEMAQLIVWQWYTLYCGRVPSQAEVDGWASQLTAPGANYEAVVTAFYGSPEATAYRAR